MNKETFLQAVTHPEMVAPQHIEALEEVVENFPYCQLAHMLIAKATHTKASMLAPQKLKKAAAYAINRDVLKKLLLESHEDISDSSPLTKPLTSEDNSVATAPSPIPEEATQAFPPIFELPHSLEDKLLSELENTVLPVETSPEDAQKIRERQRQLELIENFIKTAPRIASPKADDTFPDKDLSEKSSSLNNKLISESLAKIMVKQGKIEKAVKIYQELICKYPDKKGYFAGKIEELNSNS